MQRRTPYFSILPTAVAIAIAAGASCPSGARAAELGDARVSSHIGQQLVADIELTMLDDAHAPVQVRLADPEVYSGAGIALPPALSTLSLSVMRRDGRQFLHATTLRPVDADHLHLYVELVDHGQRTVRLATLWLTPDPHPALLPLPAPLPAAAAAPAPVSASAPAPAPVPTQAGVPVRVSAPARARGEAGAASPTPAPARHSPFALPLPLPLHRTTPATCAPQDGDAQSCTALGARNAELRSRIGQLEERVKGLQARFGVAPGEGGAKPAAAADAHPALPPPVALDAKADAKPEAKPETKPEPKPAPPPGPKPISSIKPLVAHKPKTPPPDDDLPLGAIGAGLALLAAAGAGAALLRSRAKRRRNVDIPGGPGLLDRLRLRFGKRGGAQPSAAPRIEPADAAVAEPSLE